MTLEHAVLGQSGSVPTTQILFWVFLLIVLIVLGGLVVIALRRTLLTKDSRIGHESGLMDEMRGLHARGELTTEEYDLIRKRLAAKAAARLAEEPPAQPRNRPEQSPGSKAAEKWLAGIQADLDEGPILPGRPRPKGIRPEEMGPENGPDDSRPSPPAPRRPSPGPAEDPPADPSPGHDADGFPERDWPGTSE